MGHDAMSDRCCDACYNSHGGCIEHGSCLCHAGTSCRLFFGDAGRTAAALDAIRSGASWAHPHSACTFADHLLTARYPEGATMERAVLGSVRDGECGIMLTLGVWVAP